MNISLDKASIMSSRPVIGKDVLDLLSTAMYVDPLTIYREYVQNAADAIDAARQAGLIADDCRGRIEVTVDPVSRSIKLRDNGAGISSSSFKAVLTAIGASSKRGTGARGFRGVGRLSGLAYARELSFRSSAVGEDLISTITWDCRALRSVLRDLDDRRELADIVGEITTATTEPCAETSEHFFEVILTGVARIGDDRLLSPDSVADYLSQVAPIPFSDEFSFAPLIQERLQVSQTHKLIDIVVNEQAPLARPFRDVVPVGGGRPLLLREVRIVEVPNVDGGTAAIAWVAHHDYEGAIHPLTRVRGLRARIGDIQVGETNVFEDIFPEARFNAWTVGEVHIIDQRIVPNGRRDDFERNVHLANLKNHLAPLGREIAAKCRTSSRDRKRLRDFELARESASENIDILKQGSLSAKAREQVALSVDLTLLKMEKLATPNSANGSDHERAVIEELRNQLNDVTDSNPASSPLERMNDGQRALYEEMFALIYECSVNRAAAKALIDRILLKLA